MRRIPRQIRLDPAYDQRVRAQIAATGGEQTVTDVIHAALADFFRVRDGGATLERVASDLHVMGQEIHDDKATTAAALREMTAAMERIETARLRDHSALKTQVSELKAELSAMKETLSQVEKKVEKRRLF